MYGTIRKQYLFVVAVCCFLTFLVPSSLRDRSLSSALPIIGASGRSVGSIFEGMPRSDWGQIAARQWLRTPERSCTTADGGHPGAWSWLLFEPAVVHAQGDSTGSYTIFYGPYQCPLPCLAPWFQASTGGSEYYSGWMRIWPCPNCNSQIYCYNGASLPPAVVSPVKRRRWAV